MKGVKFGEYHTYDNWGLLMSPNWEIGAPAIKSKKIDIEGADGNQDYTDFFGGVKFGNRTLKFEFIKPTLTTANEFMIQMSEISDLLHGRKMKIVLDDDAEYYYIGRAEIASFSVKQGIGTVEIAVDAEPYKLKRQLTKHYLHLSGRNLINNSSPDSVIVTGVTMTTINTGIRLTSQFDGEYMYTALKVLPASILVGQKISAQCKAVASGTNKAQIGLGYATPASTKIYFVHTVAPQGTVSMTVSEEMAAKYQYVVLFIYGNLTGIGKAGDYVDYTNLQVEIGEATEYTAYNNKTNTVTLNAISSRMPSVPTIFASKGATVTKDGYSVALTAEQNVAVSEMQLEQGDNKFTVTGTGLVLISHQEGSL